MKINPDMYDSSRGYAIINLPLTPIACIIDIGISATGVAASALSILTGGLNSKINEYANKYTFNCSLILTISYRNVLNILNPNAKFASDVIAMGIITEKLARPILQKAGTAAKNESSFLQKHVVSRGAFALSALVAIITRTADLALGLLALPLSFITLGTVEKINTFTYKQLLFPALIDEVCVGMRGFVNPQQFNTTN